MSARWLTCWIKTSGVRWCSQTAEAQRRQASKRVTSQLAHLQQRRKDPSLKNGVPRATTITLGGSCVRSQGGGRRTGVGMRGSYDDTKRYVIYPRKTRLCRFLVSSRSRRTRFARESVFLTQERIHRKGQREKEREKDRVQLARFST